MQEKSGLANQKSTKIRGRNAQEVRKKCAKIRTHLVDYQSKFKNKKNKRKMRKSPTGTKL